MKRLMSSGTALMAVATLAAAAPPAFDPQVEALKQRIWATFSDVDAAQRASPPARRSSGPALQALYATRRAPVVAELWRLGSTEPKGSGGLQALGLVLAWGESRLAQQALRLAVQDHADDDALAPVLEAAYGESQAPGKRGALQRLAAFSRSKSVAGSSLFLLAQETLSTPAGPDPRRRAVALAQLRRVRAAYGFQPTTLLAAGGSGRLGPAAAAALFQEERLAVGARLPLITVHDLDGHAVSSASLRDRYTLIDFWATWCPPCVAAFPTLADLQREHGDRLHVVSISADASPSSAAAFVRREGATWTQWYAGPSGVISPGWANGSYPYFLLVGPTGRILNKGQDITAITAAVDREVR